ALALFASWYATRPATASRSYGFYRAEILAALVNGLALVAIVGFIAWEAIGRLRVPHEVAGGGMLLVAVAGLAVNLIGIWLLHRHGGEGLNVRGALLHVLGDAIGSVGAIAAAVIVLATGWSLADPIVSLAIGVIILISAYHLLRQTVDVLMESVPPHLDLEQIRDDLAAIPGVQKVHDLHVWTLTTGFVSMSGHLVVRSDGTVADRQRVLLDAQARLRDHFDIQHTTIQLESPDDPEQPVSCSGDPRCL
ncbi:MAG TPA: cation diffusion facilitator family transporter, partial [Dehalococcoidia bacterium]|nr:cation diffusion facilitator family transporter [Dehalococcoidia bacterium]